MWAYTIHPLLQYVGTTCKGYSTTIFYLAKVNIGLGQRRRARKSQQPMVAFISGCEAGGLVDIGLRNSRLAMVDTLLG